MEKGEHKNKIRMDKKERSTLNAILQPNIWMPETSLDIKIITIYQHNIIPFLL